MLFLPHLLRLPMMLLATMTFPAISTASRPFSFLTATTAMLLAATTTSVTVNAASSSSSASSVVAIAACDGRSDKKELQVICKVKTKKCKIAKLCNFSKYVHPLPGLLDQKIPKVFRFRGVEKPNDIKKSVLRAHKT